MQTADLSCARDAFQRVLGIGTVVSFEIDGSPMLGAFELDEVEHMRRNRQGVGAVTSCGIAPRPLAAADCGPVAAGCLPDIKVRRLRAAPEVVEETAQGFIPHLLASRILRAVAFVGRSLQQRVWRGSAICADRRAVRSSDYKRRPIPLRVEYLAREWGVGIIRTGRGRHLRVECSRSGS